MQKEVALEQYQEFAAKVAKLVGMEGKALEDIFWELVHALAP